MTTPIVPGPTGVEVTLDTVDTIIGELGRLTLVSTAHPDQPFEGWITPADARRLAMALLGWSRQRCEERHGDSRLN